MREAAHRDDPELHDDLDLSFRLGVRSRVRRHRHPALSISARPFDDAAAFRRRLRRGWRTVALHWPAQLPPFRLARRVMARMRRRSAQALSGGADRRSRS